VDESVDILIIGGGLTGATLMLALDALGYKCLLVERRAFEEKINADFDARSLALSPASAHILSMLGIWPLLQDYLTPIQSIHVSDQHRFGSSLLQAQPDQALGHIIEMQHINQSILQLLAKEHLLAPATLVDLNINAREALLETSKGRCLIKAKLIVAADGAESSVRRLCDLPVKKKEYKQEAIVANIGLTKPHRYQAFERFTPEGPLALLPMPGNKMSLVWAMTPEKAQQRMALDDTQFLHSLQEAFGYRLGRFVKIGRRYSYPLQQLLMKPQGQWPVVFIGNAAHTLHPVAGQGFNLGLRDVAALAQAIAEYGLTAEMLDFYVKIREQDQKNIIGLTNSLVSLFTSSLPGMAMLRDLGLLVLDNSPFLKKCFSRYAQGYSGIIPDLVCQIPLSKRASDESF
jgi:2-octaprenyl-6-methoxyphenol hydroxylase